MDGRDVSISLLVAILMNQKVLTGCGKACCKMLGIVTTKSFLWIKLPMYRKDKS
jgi:hypothetical protein